MLNIYIYMRTHLYRCSSHFILWLYETHAVYRMHWFILGYTGWFKVNGMVITLNFQSLGAVTTVELLHMLGETLQVLPLNVQFVRYALRCGISKRYWNSSQVRGILLQSHLRFALVALPKDCGSIATSHLGGISL